MTDQFDNNNELIEEDAVEDDLKEEDEYEKFCFLCRRPESQAGKMIELPNNIHICTECMPVSYTHLPGPLIYKQERVGIHNKTFWMYKFRSMEVQPESEERKAWTVKNDPRDVYKRQGFGGIAGHCFVQQPRGNTGYCHRIICAQDYSAVTAACMMVKKKAFDEAGGLSPDLAVAFNDIDFCLKVRSHGYLVVRCV